MIGGREQAKQQAKAQLDKADYLNEAVRFNVFSLEKQQENKDNITKFFIFFMNLIAVIFESLLHVNLGRDYVNPIAFFLGILRGIYHFIAKGGIVGIIVFAAFMYFLYLANYSSLFLKIFNVGFDVFHSIWLKAFFIIGFAAMIIQAIYAFATFKITKRFSQSNGTPWLYYLTRLPFFKGLAYIIYGEPLIIILTSSTLLFLVGVDEAKFILFFGFIYLVRNISVHSIIDKEMVKRIDMGIQSVAEQVSQPEKPKPVQASTQAKKPNASRADELEDFD